jgi:hypothetical protein
MSGRGTNFPILLHPKIWQRFTSKEKDGGIFKTSGCKMAVKRRERRRKWSED